MSTPLTASLSMQQVTADSNAAQVPARLQVEVIEAEVQAWPEGAPAVAEEEVPVVLEGVPVVEVEDSMVVEGVNTSLINGGKNDV